jgi:hypothetical protein
VAKSTDKNLFQTLRASGLRKSTARRLSQPQSLASRAGSEVIGNLRTLVEELEDRAKGGPTKRRKSALKGAATRRKKAAERSARSRKAAATRAKNKKR